MRTEAATMVIKLIQRPGGRVRMYSRALGEDRVKRTFHAADAVPDAVGALLAIASPAPSKPILGLRDELVPAALASIDVPVVTTGASHGNEDGLLSGSHLTQRAKVLTPEHRDKFALELRRIAYLETFNIILQLPLIKFQIFLIDCKLLHLKARRFFIRNFS